MSAMNTFGGWSIPAVIVMVALTGCGDPSAGDFEQNGIVDDADVDPSADPAFDDGVELELTECGNGIVEGGEACDDGNTVNVDACDATCSHENCVVGVTHHSIQEAVNDVTCEQIALPEGTYQENVRIARDVSIVGAGRLASIVDAGGAGRPFEVDSSVVAFADLQMANGSAARGGGLFSAGTTTLTDVTVTGNVASDLGGGVFSAGGTITLSGVRLSSNQARLGGGLAAVGATVRVDRGSLVARNRAVGDATEIARGGGLHLEECATSIADAELAANTADGGLAAEGGGIFASGGTLALSGSRIVRNVAGGSATTTSNGGGLRLGKVAATIENDTTIEENHARAVGMVQAGGLLCLGGTLSIAGSSVVRNLGVGEDEGVGGGGLALLGCPTTVEDTDISENVVTGSNIEGSGGGAAYVFSSTVRFTRVTMFSNEAQIAGSGGALAVESPTTFTSQVTLDSSTLEGNMALGTGTGTARGGAIAGFGGGQDADVALVLLGSTLAGNRALAEEGAHGGAVYLAAEDDNASIVLTATNSTISGNEAAATSVTGVAEGGAFFLSAEDGTSHAALELYSTTLAFNSVDGSAPRGAAIDIVTHGTASSEASLSHAIVSDNVGADQCALSPTNAEVISHGYNLVGADFGCSVVGDTTGNQKADPRLGPLADNGGPTRTHAIARNSPAWNAGDPGGCRDRDGAMLAVDQRELPRPVRACDIGSFEAQTP